MSVPVYLCACAPAFVRACAPVRLCVFISARAGACTRESSCVSARVVSVYWAGASALISFSPQGIETYAADGMYPIAFLVQLSVSSADGRDHIMMMTVDRCCRNACMASMWIF